MYKFAASLFSACILLAGGNALADDAMKKDAMCKDEMKK